MQQVRQKGDREGEQRRLMTMGRRWKGGSYNKYNGLARRSLQRRRGHARAVWTRRKRASDSILYALVELRLLLQRLVAAISHRHRPATIRNPLLEAGDRPADAPLRKVEADDHRAVIWVLLRVADRFQPHCPRPQHGDEREAALIENRLGLGVLRRPGGGVEDRVVATALSIIGQGEHHISMVVHPVGAEVIFERGLSDALA